MRIHLLGLIIITGILSLSSVSLAEFQLVGNSVIEDDANVFINITPHTPTGSGYVNMELESKGFTGAIKAVFGFDMDNVKPKSIDLWSGGEWQSITNSFTKLNHTYDGKDTWYRGQFNVVAGTKYTVRYYLEIPVNSSGKYDFGIYPAFHTIQSAISAGAFYYIDPWFNSTFLNRIQLTIANNNATNPLPNGSTIVFAFDHNALVAAGQADATGRDLIVVSNVTGVDLQIDRVLELTDDENRTNLTDWNETNTTIIFATQESIAGGANSSNYFLYFNNPAAQDPLHDIHKVIEFYDEMDALGNWTCDGNCAAFLNDTGTQISLTAASTFGHFFTDINYTRNGTTKMYINFKLGFGNSHMDTYVRCRTPPVGATNECPTGGITIELSSNRQDIQWSSTDDTGFRESGFTDFDISILPPQTFIITHRYWGANANYTVQNATTKAIVHELPRMLSTPSGGRIGVGLGFGGPGEQALLYWVDSRSNVYPEPNVTQFAIESFEGPPNVTLISPVGNVTTSPGLTFNAVSNNTPLTCEFELDGAANQSLVDCVNTTLVVTVGEHTVILFVNDSTSQQTIVESIFNATAVPLGIGLQNINATQDTWVIENIDDPPIATITGIGTINLTADRSYGNESRVLATYKKKIGPSTVDIADVRTLFKFDPTPLQERVIDSVNFLWVNTFNECPSSNKTLFFQTDDSWNELTVTFNNQPTFPTTEISDVGRLRTFSLGGQPNLTLNLNQSPEFIDDLYVDIETTVQTDKNVYVNGVLDNCGGTDVSSVQNQQVFNVRNDDDPARFFVNLVDFRTEQTTFNGGGIFETKFFHFDFESIRLQRPVFDEADFKFDIGLNQLTPLVPAVRISTENNDINTLATIDCSVATGYSLDTIFIKDPAQDNFDVICFNQSTEHNQRNFFGAIKVVQYNTPVLNVGGTFTYFSALYSPSFSIFSDIKLLPDPPQEALDLNISWKTTLSLSTLARIQKQLVTGNFSPFISIQNATDFTEQHSVIFPGSAIESGFYQFQLEGSDVLNNTFNSTLLNFTVGATQFFDPNSTAPLTTDSIPRLVDLGLFDSVATGTYVFSLLVLAIVTGAVMHFGGFQTGLSVFAGGFSVFSSVGLLPQFLLIPLIVISTIIIVNFFRKTFTS